jgi:hypothetical protein
MSHIAVIDAMSFYYDDPVHPDSRWAFTIVMPIIAYKDQMLMSNVAWTTSFVTQHTVM